MLLRDMLGGGGGIQESTILWAAPVVLEKKKDGSWRFCVDYWKLNTITHKDTYPGRIADKFEEVPDLELAKIRQWWQDGERLTWEERQSLQPSERQLLEEWERLEVRDRVLVRRHPARDGLCDGVAIAAPAAEERKLWDEYHAALGHAKGSRLLMALRVQLFWIRMSRDSHQWAQECPQCVLSWPEAEPRAPLCSIASGYPWETMALDYYNRR
ncbi:hypothetical protein ACEWY4_023617 [Coilia grayii]|uniref:Gypsy retrotransposon integrase-like protein 1 n=1 Tax=Coilia grayii TaxID=363190 RepID=A0ABD1J3S3_9TELE